MDVELEPRNFLTSPAKSGGYGRPGATFLDLDAAHRGDGKSAFIYMSPLEKVVKKMRTTIARPVYPGSPEAAAAAAAGIALGEDGLPVDGDVEAKPSFVATTPNGRCFDARGHMGMSTAFRARPV